MTADFFFRVHRSPTNGGDVDDDWTPLWRPPWPELPRVRWPELLDELPEPPASALSRDRTLSAVPDHVRQLIASITPLFSSALRQLCQHENIFETGAYRRFRERADLDEWRRSLPAAYEVAYRRARWRRDGLTGLDGERAAEETSRLAFVAWFLRQLRGPMNKCVVAIAAIADRLRQLDRYAEPAPGA